jgi:hypothetical protein
MTLCLPNTLSRLILAFLVAGSPFAALSGEELDLAAIAAEAWKTVPGILERIVPPEFPQREFAITDFDAQAGGDSDCTAAFRAAIAACHKAGGGRVTVPAGEYRTGPIHLQSNVELHLEVGAEIVFSDRFEDYLPPVLVRVGGIELYNYSPLVYARDCTNIAVTGKGKLNGNARAWWDWAKRETSRRVEMGETGVPVEQRVFGTPESAIRPSFLSFVNCTNVLLEDFTIGSGPNWTIHPIYCQNVTIRGVQVKTDGPNNDGVDPDSCRDVLIENCTFDTGDDCVVLKSGYNQDGWRVGRPTENVIMRNCTGKRGHGGLVIGSEMSGDVRNVFLEDCTFEGTDRAIRIKSRADRGGVVENVFARNLTVSNMQSEFIILNMDYGADRSELKESHPPVFRRMFFEKIAGAGAPTAILIQGMEDSPIQDLGFQNLSITSTAGVVANCIRGVVFQDVSIQPARGPAFSLSQASEITIRRALPPERSDTFLRVTGRLSQGILIEDCNLTGVKLSVAKGEEVPADAVTIR